MFANYLDQIRIRFDLKNIYSSIDYPTSTTKVFPITAGYLTCIVYRKPLPKSAILVRKKARKNVNITKDLAFSYETIQLAKTVYTEAK